MPASARRSLPLRSVGAAAARRRVPPIHRSDRIEPEQGRSASPIDLVASAEAVALAGIDEAAAGRRRRPRPGAPGEQQAGLVAGDARGSPARGDRAADGVQHVLDLGDRRAHDEVAVRRARGEILLEIAGSHRRIDPALLELDRGAVLVVDDRRMEDGIAGLRPSAPATVLVRRGPVPAPRRRSDRCAPRSRISSAMSCVSSSVERGFSADTKVPRPGTRTITPSLFSSRSARCDGHARDVQLLDQEVLGGQPLRVAPFAGADAVDDELLHLLVERLRGLGSQHDVHLVTIGSLRNAALTRRRAGTRARRVRTSCR